VGTLPSLDYNLIQDATGCSFAGPTAHTLTNTTPAVGSLQTFGSTRVNPLPGGSTAINAGNDATCAPTNQRGVARPVEPHCDIGAFEGAGPRLLYLPVILR